MGQIFTTWLPTWIMGTDTIRSAQYRLLNRFKQLHTSQQSASEAVKAKQQFPIEYFSLEEVLLGLAPFAEGIPLIPEQDYEAIKNSITIRFIEHGQEVVSYHGFVQQALVACHPANHHQRQVFRGEPIVDNDSSAVLSMPLVPDFTIGYSMLSMLPTEVVTEVEVKRVLKNKGLDDHMMPQNKASATEQKYYKLEWKCHAAIRNYFGYIIV